MKHTGTKGRDMEAEPTRISVTVGGRDEHRWLTWTALIGLAAAAAMAVWGLPPMDLHGLLHRAGVMDPLCGGTRAAMFAARGDLATAWKYNPLGIVALVAAVGAGARTGVGLLWGRWLWADVVLSARVRRLAVLLGFVALVALEWRQQLRADLLIATL